jgi:hypothetical protein
MKNAPCLSRSSVGDAVNLQVGVGFAIMSSRVDPGPDGRFLVVISSVEHEPTSTTKEPPYLLN